MKSSSVGLGLIALFVSVCAGSTLYGIALGSQQVFTVDPSDTSKYKFIGHLDDAYIMANQLVEMDQVNNDLYMVVLNRNISAYELIRMHLTPDSTDLTLTLPLTGLENEFIIGLDMCFSIDVANQRAIFSSPAPVSSSTLNNVPHIQVFTIDLNTKKQTKVGKEIASPIGVLDARGTLDTKRNIFWITYAINNTKTDSAVILFGGMDLQTGEFSFTPLGDIGEVWYDAVLDKIVGFSAITGTNGNHQYAMGFFDTADRKFGIFAPFSDPSLNDMDNGVIAPHAKSGVVSALFQAGLNSPIQLATIEISTGKVLYEPSIGTTSIFSAPYVLAYGDL